MRISKEINDAFFAGVRNDKVKFVVNDTVHVTTGKYEGKEAAVISIDNLESETLYVLETFDGTGTIIVPQSSIKLIIASDVQGK